MRDFCCKQSLKGPFRILVVSIRSLPEPSSVPADRVGGVSSCSIAPTSDMRRSEPAPGRDFVHHNFIAKGSSGINRSGRSSKREHTTRSDRRTRFGYFLSGPKRLLGVIPVVLLLTGTAIGHAAEIPPPMEPISG